MTKEEARHWLEIELKTWEDECKSKHPIKEALSIAIEDLEQEPSYNSVNSLVESKLKNPKAKTFDILHFVADNAGLSTFEAIEKAYNMGVSEQEQVLSKIRVEMFEEMLSHSGTGEEVIQAYVDGLKKGLDILDKLVESEDKE